MSTRLPVVQSTTSHLRDVRAVARNAIAASSVKFSKPRSILTSAYLFKLDSGCDEHCTNDPTALEDVTNFDSSHPAPIELVSASNHVLGITSKGSLNKDIMDVYVSEDLNGSLLSGPQLQRSGHWVIHPPATVSRLLNAVVLDSQGNVVAIADCDGMIDTSLWGTYDKQVALPDLSSITDRICCADAIYGFKAHGIVDMVNFTHKIFHVPKPILALMADYIKDFPVTSGQVDRYCEDTCLCCIRGSMSNKPRRMDGPRHENDDPPLLPTSEFHNVEHRNFEKGAEVGADFFGPHYGYIVLTFTEKATGFAKSYLIKLGKPKKSSKLEAVIETKTSMVVRLVIKYFKRFGIMVRVLRSDKDSAFNSAAVKDVLNEYDVTPLHSPPGRKYLNGLAESKNKHLKHLTTAFFSCARHMPEVFWPYAWELATIVSNLYPSRVQGEYMTRYEAITKSRPQWQPLALMPFGQPVEYIIQKPTRDGSFGDHSRPGAYLSPDPDTPGNIFVFNFNTKRISSVATYTILRTVYSEWKEFDPKTFVISLEESNQPEDEVVSGIVSPVLPASLIVAPVTDHLIPLSVATAPQHVLVNVPDNTVGIEHVVVVDRDPPIPTEASASEGGGERLVSEGDERRSATEGNERILVSEGATETPIFTTHSSADTPQADSEDSPSKKSSTRNRGTWRDGPARLRSVSHYMSGAARRAAKTARMAMFLHNTADYLDQVRITLDDNSLHVAVSLNDRDRSYVYRVRCYPAARKAGSARLKGVHRTVGHKKAHMSDRDPDKPSMKQAMSRADWKEFKKAIDDEMDQLRKEGVYDGTYVKVKDLPPEVNLVGSMFTLVIKRDPTTGAIIKYKARLVALGNQQLESSYDAISSQTARGASVKLLIALQAKLKAYSMVLDVKGAYLKSVIDESKNERLYVRLPDGRIIKLRRYLYGLKQAGYEWQINVTQTLTDAGYRSTADPLVFVKRVGKKVIFMSIHVDDFYVVSTCRRMMNDLYTTLTDKYNEVSRKSEDMLAYLGMSIITDPTTNIVTVSQPAYIDKMIAIAKMESATGLRTPMAVTYSEGSYDDTVVDQHNYLKLVGLINYLATYSRPDLLYSLSRAAQKCSKPTVSDLSRVKRIFKYIIATRDYGIRFNCDDDFTLVCHVDASFNCYDDGKGHYGYSISLGHCNGSFIAKSGKIKLVTLSSTETEYVAMSYAATEIVYLRRLLEDLGFSQRKT